MIRHSPTSVSARWLVVGLPLAIGCSSALDLTFFPKHGKCDEPAWPNSQSSPSPPSTEDPLLQGLLDEVRAEEPANAPDGADKTGQGTESATPENADTDDPFEAIQVEMVAATRFLMRGKLDTETLQLQKEIVMRLDEVIQAFEETKKTKTSQRSSDRSRDVEDPSMQPRTNNQKPGDKSSGNVESRNGDTRNGDYGQRSADNADSAIQAPTGDDQEAAGNGKGAAGGGDRASASNSTSAIDPNRLNKGVWGHLPERTRKQMQSNNSDRFLPKYRARIEEYYRRLSQEK